MAARFLLVHEFCHDCGRKVRTVWTADNVVWSGVMGEDTAPRCSSCFTRRAERHGLFIRWVPQIEEKL